ncbi:MAG: hypothetical protein LC800_18445 [Acidobacteria bacterium]|nr:hypothetical protein [Acidobacteriota bacterium]
MLTAYKICSWLIAALGCAHVLFTLHDYEEFSLRALWFLGSGLALVFAGFLNVAHLRAPGRDTLVRALTVLTNVLCALLFVAALSLMRQPQVFVGIALFAFAALMALRK